MQIPDERVEKVIDYLLGRIGELEAESKEARNGWDEWMDRCEATLTENEDFRDALQSIASNTCCDRCQEAALVAKAALEGK